jgi:hypothetical protein
VPVEVTRACGDVAVSPEASLAGGAVAGSEVVDGCFIDLEFAGAKEFGFDRLVDRGEVPGGGVGSGIEGLAPDVDVVPSSEALGLAVVGKVVLVFVGDDLGGKRGGEQGAGDGRKRCGGDERRAGFFGAVDEFPADGAPPEDLGFDDVEFVVVLFADFLPVAGVGEDFIGDDFLFDEDFEVPGETLSLGAAVFCAFGFSPPVRMLLRFVPERGAGFPSTSPSKRSWSCAGVMFFRNLFRALIPRAEGGFAQIHAVDEKLQGFGVELDAVAAFVGEDEKGVACRRVALELVGGELLEAVEGLAHVAGVEGEEDLEGVCGQVQHVRPHFPKR